MGILESFEELDWVTGSFVLGIVFIITVVISILTVRKTIGRKTLQAHHDVTGFVFTNLGVLFSVLLGFTVVNVQQRFDKIRETTQVEASYLADLYHGAAVFSSKDSARIREEIKQYIENIIHDEWPLMSKRDPSLQTSEQLKALWNSYYTVQLDTPNQQIWYAESIKKLNQLVDTRLARILGAEDSLSEEMWTFLFLGAITLVLFISFFGVENIRAHVFLGSILAISTAYLLFLIHSLDTAYTGKIQVSPDALERILKTLN